MQTVVMQTKHQKHDSDHAHVPEQRFDIHAIGFGSHRRYGELAEAEFLAKAAGMGFGVSRPWGDERYDFVLDSGHGFSRVQVKSTRKSRAPRSYGVVVSSNRLAAYDATEIDFLVAYVVPLDLWYVIPVNKIQGTMTLYFHPDGCRSKWEKYREAWCLMACPHDEIGPSKIVTPRCCDKGPIRLPICPLKLLR
jgi:hypothetical protein